MNLTQLIEYLTDLSNQGLGDKHVLVAMTGEISDPDDGLIIVVSEDEITHTNRADPALPIPRAPKKSPK